MEYASVSIYVVANFISSWLIQHFQTKIEHAISFCGMPIHTEKQ